MPLPQPLGHVLRTARDASGYCGQEQAPLPRSSWLRDSALADFQQQYPAPVGHGCRQTVQHVRAARYRGLRLTKDSFHRLRNSCACDCPGARGVLWHEWQPAGGLDCFGTVELESNPIFAAHLLGFLRACQVHTKIQVYSALYCMAMFHGQLIAPCPLTTAGKVR